MNGVGSQRPNASIARTTGLENRSTKVFLIQMGQISADDEPQS